MHRLLARLSPVALVAALLVALPASPATAAALPDLQLRGDAIGDSTMANELGLLFADAFDQALPDACDVAAGLQGYSVSVDVDKFCFNPSSSAFVPDLSLEGMCRSILAPTGVSLVDTAVSRTSVWTLDNAGNARGCVYPSGTANSFKGWASAYKSALSAYRKQGFDSMQAALASCDDSMAANACMVRDSSGQYVPDPKIFKPLAPPPMPTQAAAAAVTIANVASMAAAASAQTFVKTDGSVVSRCDSTMPNTPSSVCTVPSSVGVAVAVAAARSHTVALKADGGVAEWGSILVGGTVTVARPPTIADAVGVAAGDNFAVALLSNGSVVAWGDAADAQIAVPAGLTQVKQVAAGRCHTVALKDDGTVAAWGCSQAGQTSVGALRGVIAIDAMGDSTLAWFADGTSVVIGSTEVVVQTAAGTSSVAGAAGTYFISGEDCQKNLSEYALNDAGTPSSISAPSDLSVTTSPADGSTWRFTWTAPANAASKPGYTYEARYSATNGRTWTDWTPAVSPFDVPKPANGIVARFDVRAVYKSVSGAWVPGPKSHMVVQETTICGGNQSSSVSAALVRAAAAAPSAPQAVVASSPNSRTLRISFAPAAMLGVAAGVADATTYTVRYSTNGGTWSSVPVRGVATAITGLSGGVTYQIQVTAANRFGTAMAAISAKTAADAVVPSLWTTAVAARTVSLAWKAAVFPVGSKDKVSDYKVEVAPDGGTWTAFAHKASTKTSITVTGLRAGLSHQFRVSAVSSSGIGVATAPITVTTSTAAPMPITGLILSPRTPTSISASWQAPVDTGGLPITSYQVTTTSAGATIVVDGTTAVVSSLTTGSSVTLNVIAKNSLGSSTVVSAKTVVVGPAAAPTLSVQRLTSSVVVTWKAPTNTGGSAIKGYTVTRSPDGLPMVVAGTKATISGLNRGDKVTVTVAAVTAFGGGSPATTVVSPLDVPGPPVSLTYASKDVTKWSVAWLAPTDTGGSSIKGYRISISNDGGTTWGTASAVSKSPFALSKSLGATRIVKVWAYNAIGDGAPITLTVTN
mgnify:CR=1 FL=1